MDFFVFGIFLMDFDFLLNLVGANLKMGRCGNGYGEQNPKYVGGFGERRVIQVADQKAECLR